MCEWRHLWGKISFFRADCQHEETLCVKLHKFLHVLRRGTAPRQTAAASSICLCVRFWCVSQFKMDWNWVHSSFEFKIAISRLFVFAATAPPLSSSLCFATQAFFVSTHESRAGFHYYSPCFRHAVNTQLADSAILLCFLGTRVCHLPN